MSARRATTARSAKGFCSGYRGADVDQQAGALGQDHRPQPCGGQPQRDPAGGPVLGAGELGVRVQVAAEFDQLGLVSGQEHVQIRAQVIACHDHHHPRAAEPVLCELA